MKLMKKFFMFYKKLMEDDNVNQEKHSLKQIGLFLIYTFSITWMSWLIIIIGNRYFNALWYGEPLFWIPMLIGGLGPTIGSYIIIDSSMKILVKNLLLSLYLVKN